MFWPFNKKNKEVFAEVSKPAEPTNYQKGYSGADCTATLVQNRDFIRGVRDAALEGRMEPFFGASAQFSAVSNDDFGFGAYIPPTYTRPFKRYRASLIAELIGDLDLAQAQKLLAALDSVFRQEILSEAFVGITMRRALNAEAPYDEAALRKLADLGADVAHADHAALRFAAKKGMTETVRILCGLGAKFEDAHACAKVHDDNWAQKNLELYLQGKPELVMPESEPRRPGSDLPHLPIF